MLLKLFFAALMLTVTLVDAKALDDKGNENYIKAKQQITLQTHPEQIHLSYGGESKFYFTI